MGLFVNWHKNEHLPTVVLFVLLILSTMLTFNVCITQAGEQDLHQPIRVRIFTLRNITTQRAKEYLGLSQVADTVVAIPGTNAVSVTGMPQELVYAATVLKLVDSAEIFDVQMLDVQPEQVLPDLETIVLKLGREYSVGSLLEGPVSEAAIKAIICLHKDKLLIISPQDQTSKITETVQEMTAQKQEEAEPNLFEETVEDINESVEPVIPEQIELTITEETAEPTEAVETAEIEEIEKIAATEDIAETVEPARIEMPVVVETNEVQDIAVEASPVPSGKKMARTEDDMLSGFLNELTAAAIAEKEEAPASPAPPSSTDVDYGGQAVKLPLSPKAAADESEDNKDSDFRPSPLMGYGGQVAGASPDKLPDKAEKIEEEPVEVEQIIPAEPMQQKQEVITQRVIERPEQKKAVIEEPVIQQPEEKKQSANKIQEQSSIESRVQVTEAEDFAAEPVEEEKMPVIPVIDIPNGDEVLELNLPEKVEIVALIDLVGKYLGLNYLYDETKVKGNVTVKVQGKLRVRELYDLLESVLKFRGFVMSRKGNLVTIAPAIEIMDQDPTFAEGIKAGDVVITNVFNLQHISTDAAKKLLGEMKLGSNITEIPESGTLVITEYAFRMQRIEDLLTLVDVPGPPKEFKLRVLKYTLAESLVPKVKDLAEQLGTVDVTIGITAPASPAAPTRRGRRTPTPAAPTPEAAKKTGVFIDFDKRTNRVLMIGLAEEIKAVDQIINSLDVPQQDLRVISEYEIQYVDIEKIVTALKELGIIDTAIAGAQPGSAARSRTPPGAPAPAAVTEEGPVSLDQPQVVMLESTNSLLVNATPEQHIQITRIISYIDREPVQAAIPYRIYRLENQEPEALAEVLNNLIEKTIKDKEGKIQQTVKIQEEIAVVPDKNTFSLIVYASRKNQEWIGSLIKSLDTRRPQVLIDVSLVEVTRNDAFQFDLDLVGNAKGLVTDNLKVPALVSTAIGGNREAGFAPATGTTTGFYSADKIQALLTMVNSKGYGRVLAQPKILVNDNEEGTIETSEKTYVSEQTQSYPGTTTGSTPIPVTTQTWKDYSAKIKLTITPQISEGDLLRLEVDMTREDFGKQPTGAPPDMTTSNVKTVVTVPDGSTIILGGLNKLKQAKGGNKVPLLGDLPIAGGLFRSVDNSNDERRLYVFVKANILRPDVERGLHQLKDVSRKNQIEFEKAEDKFQEHEDFPGLKPELVEPRRVLGQEANEPDKK